MRGKSLHRFPPCGLSCLGEVLGPTEATSSAQPSVRDPVRLCLQPRRAAVSLVLLSALCWAMPAAAEDSPILVGTRDRRRRARLNLSRSPTSHRMAERDSSLCPANLQPGALDESSEEKCRRHGGGCCARVVRAACSGPGARRSRHPGERADGARACWRTWRRAGADDAPAAQRSDPAPGRRLMDEGLPRWAHHRGVRAAEP